MKKNLTKVLRNNKILDHHLKYNKTNWIKSICLTIIYFKTNFISIVWRVGCLTTLYSIKSYSGKKGHRRFWGDGKERGLNVKRMFTLSAFHHFSTYSSWNDTKATSLSDFICSLFGDIVDVSDKIDSMMSEKYCKLSLSNLRQCLDIFMNWLSITTRNSQDIRYLGWD